MEMYHVEGADSAEDAWEWEQSRLQIQHLCLRIHRLAEDLEVDDDAKEPRVWKVRSPSEDVNSWPKYLQRLNKLARAALNTSTQILAQHLRKCPGYRAFQKTLTECAGTACTSTGNLQSRLPLQAKLPWESTGTNPGHMAVYPPCSHCHHPNSAPSGATWNLNP